MKTGLVGRSNGDGFVDKYGPWALVAGASEGIGEAFAIQLADRGLNLILIARNQEKLRNLQGRLGGKGISVKILPLDLADEKLLEIVDRETKNLPIGLVVYNACFASIEPFINQDLEEKLKHLDVNCRGPVILAHHFAPKMSEKGRGGIILMSSMAGFQGSALVSTYAATKAFNTVLGESLWAELRPKGVRKGFY